MTRSALSTALVCAAVLAVALSAAPASADTPFQRGFVLTGSSSDTYLTARSDRVLAQMADAGSGTAAVFTQWFMDNPTSSHIAPDASRTPSDAAIAHAAARASEMGMQVTLKPQIGIRTGNWIGYAHPADLSSFWADYRTMLIHYADLAQQIGATTLVIGTEMQTLSWDQAHWRPLIAEIRSRFHGALTYAANYDEYPSVPFWDAVDFIGIDAYFGLADESNPAPSTAELVSAWTSRGYLGSIAAVSQRTGKQVLFTEIGYRGIHRTAVHPNQWNLVDSVDLQAQANAYEAFYAAVASQPWMAGVYWWEARADSWWVKDYSPLGKPAGQVMTDWNRAALAVPPAGGAGDMVAPPEPSPMVEPQPPAQPPQPQPPQPASSAPPAVTVKLRRRRLSGSVSPYTAECAGQVQLQVRRRVAGKWRHVPPPATFAPGTSGRFTLIMRPGRLRVRAVFTSPCAGARSGWTSNAR
jgi:hypothetical protein